jgi:DNA polymerase (family 10)
VSDTICKLPFVRDVVAHGDTKISFDLRSGLRVDVRIVDENQWGAALLYFTGSKEHNIELRKRAIAKGWKLNEYGLFDGDKVIAQRNEKDIYEALGLKYCEPRNR